MTKTAILATLAFYANNPGWHTFDRRCMITKRTVKRLAALGFLEIFAPGNQARFTGKATL